MLRMRRRRNRKEQVRETMRGGMRHGRERASKAAAIVAERGSVVARDVAERGSEVAREVAEASANKVATVAREVADASATKAAAVAAERLPRRKTHRVRRAGAGMLAFMIVAGLVTCLYVWWQRRREDNEYARLMPSPERPDTSPATPPAPSTPAAHFDPTPMAPAPAPVLDPAPHASTSLSSFEQAPRPAWNAHAAREALSSVLPPRPSMPFRPVSPRGTRSQLPGSGRSLV